jgi:hypothetical protein
MSEQADNEGGEANSDATDEYYQHLRRKFTPPSEREPPEYRGFAAPGEHPGFPEQSPEWEGYEV